MADDIIKKFWLKYIEGDDFTRDKIIDKMKLFESLYPVLNDKDIDLKTKKYIFLNRIRSYFDDIVDMTLVDKI
jgi:gluconate kinase